MVEEELVETDTTDPADDSAAEAKTDVDQVEESGEEATDSNITKPKEGEIDYKAELEKANVAKAKAEKLLADRAYKERERKRQDEDPVEDEDQPLTRDEVKAMVQREKESLKKETLQYEAQRLAGQMSTSDEESQLIMLKWQSMSFDPNVSLGEQIEDATAVVNKKKLVGERNEAMRALAGKDTANVDSGGSKGSETTTREPKLDAGDKSVLSDSGFSYNTATRRWEKITGNGTVLIFDSKTKKVQKA